MTADTSAPTARPKKAANRPVRTKQPTAPPYWLLVPADWDPVGQQWRSWPPQSKADAEAARDRFAARFPDAEPMRVVRVDAKFTEVPA